MSAPQPMQKIAIIADPLSAGLIASIMTARLPGAAYKIDVCITPNKAHLASIYARPNIRHVHQLLQIKEQDLALLAGGELITALPITPQSGPDFMSPFGAYGMAKQGCAFHHYWHRAYAAGQVKDLENYNFALRLAQQGSALEGAPTDCPMIEPGYKFDRVKYGQFLLNLAIKTGQINHNGHEGALKMNVYQNEVVEIIERMKTSHDLVVHVSENHKSDGWHGNFIQICPNKNIPGLFLFQVQSAMTRLFEFWPQKGRMDLEAREYNRRLGAEAAHIADMQHLLTYGASGDMAESLVRKVDLFRAKGRIAFEDYDVFSSSEWMAALTACGVEAVGYDRLADRMALENIVAWFKQLDARMSVQLQHLYGETA